MSPEFIEQLVELLKGSSIVEFEYEKGGACVRLRLDQNLDRREGYQATSGDEAPPHVPKVTKKNIVAGDIGVLRLTHPQHDKPFVALGAPVMKGQIVAFLQVGEMLREITSTVEGTLGQCLVKEGDLIGYGQAVFEIE
ncbi:acetyl-CoA carboxylase biotin carboxyl carrier protein [Pseudomonas sp. LB3P38]|uniref:acetyl-CoA carboxylase biotin carboxyl carrier protein n=1 Tax=Pseudomonas lyxosi TaxID=3398358 RepID=UPI0039EF880D